MGAIKSVVFIFFLLMSSVVLGQTTFISGSIKDEKKNPVILASVVLKDTVGNVISYTFSDEKGGYKLQVDSVGKYVISVTSLGYDRKEILINTQNMPAPLDINMQTNSVVLEEVKIKTTQPIEQKGDTIIFDAKSFAQGNEQVVEDLLKKIPGINVSADGAIKVGNKEVEKVMVGGDDFFDKGYRLLTKNMPVNPIDKVELIQKYSNNKHLKGIENSEKVALNLTLKDDYKRRWFGNMQLGYGYGSENKYEVRANLMNFGNKSKYYFLTNLNNIGMNAVGDIGHLIRPMSIGEPGSIGDHQAAKTVINLDFETPGLKQQRVNFNNAAMLSLNSIFTLSPKTKLKLLVFLNTDKNDFNKNNYDSFSVGNLSFKNVEDLKGRKKILTGFGKIDITHDFSKTKTLEFSSKYNNSKTESFSNIDFNSEPINEYLKNQNQLFDQKLVYTNRFKENKVFLLSGRFINDKTAQNYAANKFLFSDIFSEQADNTTQFSSDKMQFLGFEAQVMDRKKSGNKLEYILGSQYRADDLNTVFQLKNQNTILSKPANYQNHLKYISNDLYLTTKYLYKFKSLSLLAHASFHQLYNYSNNSDNLNHQTPFYFNPLAGLKWDINKTNRIYAAYSFNTTNAAVVDIYNNYIQTGYKSLAKGKEGFNQLNASSVVFNYTLGNWSSKFFANAQLMYSRNHDYFSNNVIITQNYVQTEKMIVKNQDIVNIAFDINRSIKPIQSNFKLVLGTDYSNYKNMVNSTDIRDVSRQSYNYGFELRSAFKGIFNYHFGTNWKRSYVKTTVSNSYKSNMSFMDLFFVLNNKCNFNIQTERYSFNNPNSKKTAYYFMDLQASYTLKENKLTFFLTGNNLFNTKTFKNYSISDLYISKTEYQLVPRNIVLKAEFRF